MTDLSTLAPGRDYDHEEKGRLFKGLYIIVQDSQNHLPVLIFGLINILFLSIFVGG